MYLVIDLLATKIKKKFMQKLFVDDWYDDTFVRDTWNFTAVRKKRKISIEVRETFSNIQMH